jgi:GT2 family glycosyltransferase
MKIAVLVVNYNGKKFLAECLDALQGQSLKPASIVMVDNGSSDGSVEFLKQNYPAITLLEEKTNLGFSGGNNIGLDWIRQEIRPDAVALVNNDTKADPGWLAALAGAIQKDPSLGSVASRMVYASDPERTNDAGDMPLWDGRALARGRDQPTKYYNEDAEVFGPCAGAALYRMTALEQVAMDGCVFDPDFFAYNEDVDLAWRLRKHGWRCLYVAGARILHHHSGTVGRFSAWVLFHGERNRCWTMIKNYSWWLIVASPLYTLARFLLVLFAPKDEKFGAAANYRARYSLFSIVWVIFKAWTAALVGTPRMVMKRWKYGLGWPLPTQLKVLRKWGTFRSRMPVQQ